MSGRPIWLWTGSAILALLVVISLGRDRGGSVVDGATRILDPRGVISISIASSSTKQEWLHGAVAAFNAASPREASLQASGKPIRVEVLQETVDGRKVDYRSGTMVSDTISGKIKPTVLSPGEESWIEQLRDEWRAAHRTSITHETGPILAQTPLVIATWESRARALGCWPDPGPDCTWKTIRALATSPDGWGMVGQSEWGKLKLGYGYVGESNSGTVSALLMCMIGAGKTSGLTLADVAADTGCGELMAGIERAKVHSGNRSQWLIEQMTRGGPEYLDAVTISESDVILMNRTHGANLRERIVSIYPQDGTVLLGHPFTILDGAPWVSPEQVTAAAVFRDFLLSAEQQRGVTAIGLRAGASGVKPEAPVELANGANPLANMAIVDLPDSAVHGRVIEVWHEVKKHAVIAVVFDKSGSMGGQKIAAAAKGAQELVRRMDRQDRLIWMPFDTTVHRATAGNGAELGEELRTRIAAVPASGGTALYDAILAAHGMLQDERRANGDSLRYGIVVLSDGQDTNSAAKLSDVEGRLRPEEHDPTGIQIHTIGIGKDADERVLKRIAAAAHGTFWKGNTEAEMVRVYRAIATYY